MHKWKQYKRWGLIPLWVQSEAQRRNIPQSTDEAVHRAFRVKRHNVSNVQEAGPVLRHRVSLSVLWRCVPVSHLSSDRSSVRAQRSSRSTEQQQSAHTPSFPGHTCASARGRRGSKSAKEKEKTIITTGGDCFSRRSRVWECVFRLVELLPVCDTDRRVLVFTSTWGGGDCCCQGAGPGPHWQGSVFITAAGSKLGTS